MNIINKLDINLLVALSTLVSEKGVTRAAARLHLSQPTVSTLLAQLRTIFDDPLLLRIGREMRPTLRAQELAQTVDQILSKINSLERPSRAFDPQTSKATFTLAVTDHMEYVLIPPLANYLKQRAPGIRLIVKQIELNNIRRQVESGDADLCVTSRHNAPQNLHSYPLYTDDTVCILRKGRSDIGKHLTLQKFCKIEHVVVSPNRLSDETDRLLTANGLSRNVTLTVPHFFMLPKIVSTSNMLSMVPRRLANQFRKTLAIYESPVKLPPYTMTAIWHERVNGDPAQAWLRQSLIEVATPNSDKYALPS